MALLFTGAGGLVIGGRRLPDPPCLLTMCSRLQGIHGFDRTVGDGAARSASLIQRLQERLDAVPPVGFEPTTQWIKSPLR